MTIHELQSRTDSMGLPRKGYDVRALRDTLQRALVQLDALCKWRADELRHGNGTLHNFYNGQTADEYVLGGGHEVFLAAVAGLQSDVEAAEELTEHNEEFCEQPPGELYCEGRR